MKLLSWEMMIKCILGEIRRKRGYTQESLASEVGCSVGWIRDQEQQRSEGIGYSILDRICEVLDCEIYEVLIREQEPNVPDDPD